MPGSFVDGEVLDLPGGPIEVHDPATGDLVDTVADVGADGVDRAVQAASDAFPDWWATPASTRGHLLRDGAAAVRDAIDELAPILTSEQGKPLRESRLELSRAAETLEHYAGLALAIRGAAVSDLDRGARAMVLTRPLGVVGAIVPWNFPTTLLSNKLGPALVTGNTVVAKPDETTPLTTLRFARILHESGLPAGVFNVVTGLGATTGQAILDHPDIRKVAFTGSTPVGRHVMRTAADTLKRVTLELGGSDPLIVLDDADVDAAISAASMGRFFNCGQACLAIKRVYASESIAERVAEGIAAKARKLVLGPGDRTGTQVGPMHSADGRELIEAQVADAVERGGEVLAGGGRPEGDEYGAGHFHQPTVVYDPAHDARVSVEETFGPVLPVWPVADLDEAIARSNASPFGLGSSVWTSDLAAAMQAAERLDAGYTWINSRTKVYDELPFGGVKQSGYGKEHGEEALSFYTEQKSVVIRT
ncbi:aldehyde dehydrogenase family protein [Salsipaludibacter albus]|uniref:aldehyde dehydrogenase family protein n=1 Tax=Salsipaludibacter albus TaxID=2849650 RepID=UPI001EE48EED|nr:aldehyde dehydrogenase family protein [Salsipaludibacter albus]MBY5163650.1 aldehyde dehydrogenase family protein [Salsipaludibacter albus]